MKRTWRSLILAAVLPVVYARADDIEGPQPVALDQPQINAAITLGGPPGTGTLAVADFGFGITTINITAYLDTGASGILLSNETADAFGLIRDTSGGQTIVYSDVGANGTSSFNVSQPLHISLAPFTPSADIDNPSTFQTVYTQTFGPVRTQIGPLNNTDENLQNVDVLGTPVMHNKVVVIDPRPANTFVDTSRVNIYNPGDANIPTVSRHVLMSKVDFSQFTATNPGGAENAPTLASNPIIGRDPTKNPQAGDPPGVTVSLGSLSTSGNFLLDTGSAASMISTSLASSLHVRYVAGTRGTNNPQLEMFDPANPGAQGTSLGFQFSLSITGIGGSSRVAGFYLDSLLLPTQEGLTNANNNLRFLDAPVLVNDITLRNPVNNNVVTLDGILGTNLLEPSAFVVQGPDGEVQSFGALTASPFSLITYEQDYDSTHSMLGLEINPNPPPPDSIDWIGPLFADETGDWNTSSFNWFDLNDPALFVKYTQGKPVLFNDSLTDVKNVNITLPVTPFAVQIQNDVVDFTFSGSAITGTASLTKSGSRTATFLNQNSYTGVTDIQQGTLVFSARQNIGGVVVRQGGHLVMGASQNFAGMNLLGGDAILLSGHNKVLVMPSLQIGGQGKLDITDNKMVLSSSAMSKSDLREMLHNGYANGAWNGVGLVSSTDASSTIKDSIGYIDNQILHLTSFGGETVTDDALLIKSTYAGDANMDGMVDLLDVYSLALNWLTDDKFWYQGDFNYDGLVNAKDLGILARNWQAGVGNPLPGDSLFPILDSFGLPPTTVPEPASLGVIAMLIAAGGSRRLRTRRKRL